MTLPAPKLYDKTAQDIIDEAKKRLPNHIKEWTDHNVSDPGVTLIELFAWMTENILYRLNRVPDLHYVRFMELLGVRLQEAQPATVPVTFWLSAALDTAVKIPQGTEVASTRTETEPAIIFTTDDDLIIQPPDLRELVCYHQRQYKKDTRNVVESLARPDNSRVIPMFSSEPKLSDTLYFGFKSNISDHVLNFHMDFEGEEGTGVQPDNPPYEWIFSTGEADAPWQICPRRNVTDSSTQALNMAGVVTLYLPQVGKQRLPQYPADMDFANEEYYWVGVRIKTDVADQNSTPYESTPILKYLRVESIGGTAMSTHARETRYEFLGYSDGSAGQKFNLRFAPILKRVKSDDSQRRETLRVILENGESQYWQEVTDFADSNENHHHFVLDSMSGELRLGPAIVDINGELKRYGAIPPRNARLEFTKYRYGGGASGNVEIGKLDTLKTSIPFVDRVRNRQRATNGLDAETLDLAKLRVPQLLRSRDRAVTVEDYEFLTQQVVQDKLGWRDGRVKCIQPTPDPNSPVAVGQVTVIVVPDVKSPQLRFRPNREILRPTEDELAVVKEDLDRRRLLGVRLEVRSATYKWVAIKIRVKGQLDPYRPEQSRREIKNRLEERLYQTFNPLTQKDVSHLFSQGWEFGRHLVIGDVYQAVSGLEGLSYVEEVEVYQVDGPTNRPGQAGITSRIDLLDHELIASAQHEVDVV